VIKRLILLFGLTGMLVSLASCDPKGLTGRNLTYEERIAREQDKLRKEAVARYREDERRRREDAERSRREGIYGGIYIPDSPDAWMSLDYTCSGALRRGQWLVCEHEQLGLLHRRLALQWEAARRVASPERLNVLIVQQGAFIRERNACEDIRCVAAAYHRYLDGAALAPRPWVDSSHRSYPNQSRSRWVRGHHDRDDDRGHRRWKNTGKHPHPGAEQRSCISEIGFPAASHLAERCDNVTPGLSSQCSFHNSCGVIRAQIDRGCGTRHNKPGYCRSY